MLSPGTIEQHKLVSHILVHGPGCWKDDMFCQILAVATDGVLVSDNDERMSFHYFKLLYSLQKRVTESEYLEDKKNEEEKSDEYRTMDGTPGKVMDILQQAMDMLWNFGVDPKK